MTTPSRADIRRLNVNLDRLLHRALKQQALDDETTESAIVRRLLVEYLTWTGALASSAQEADETTTAEVPAQQSARPGLPTAPPMRRPS